MSKAKGTRALRAMGGSEKKKDEPKNHKIHKMEIRHGAKGGFIVEHKKPVSESMASGPQEPEEHVIPNMAALQQHVQDNLGDSQPAQGAEPDPAEAAPAQGEPGQ